MVANTGHILDTAATDQHNAVLLKVMALTRNIRRHFDTIAQTHTGNLTQSRVRLLGRIRLNGRTNAALLGSGEIGASLLQGVPSLLQSGSCGLLFRDLSSLSYQLVKSRHTCTSCLDFERPLSCCSGNKSQILDADWQTYTGWDVSPHYLVWLGSEIGRASCRERV